MSSHDSRNAGSKASTQVQAMGCTSVGSQHEQASTNMGSTSMRTGDSSKELTLHPCAHNNSIARSRSVSTSSMRKPVLHTCLFKICNAATGFAQRKALVEAYIGRRGFADFAAVLHAQGLHRGVSIKNLVRTNGSSFQSANDSHNGKQKRREEPEGEAQWHKLSEGLLPNVSFSGFVSHTWKTSSWRKGITLSMYFLNKQAGIMMFWFLAALGIPLLAISKALQVDQAEIVNLLLALLIASYLAYFFIFFFGGNIPFLLRDRYSERYFLDTCCISRNSNKKSIGVYHLAEYVMASRKFIVLYEDDYTKRLWCVFELAVFFARLRKLTSGTRCNSWVRRAVQGSSELQFVFLPVFLPPISIAISLSLQACLFIFLALLVSEATVMLCMILLLVVLASTCLIFLGMRWLRVAAADMSSDFKTFSLARAGVGSQCDRAMILKSINVSWNSSESTESDCGLKEFEAFVREEISDFIMQQFGTPSNALRCLLANSGLVLAEAFVLVLAFGAMPFLLAAFMADALIGDATTIRDEYAVLSLRRRITLNRVLVWFLMLIMGIFSAIHCFGYIIVPTISLVDNSQYKIDTLGEKLAYPREVMEDFKQKLLVPDAFTIGDSPVQWICSIVFGVLAILYMTCLFYAIFLRRHATANSAKVEKPQALDTLSLKSIGKWAREWVRYIRNATKPGAEYFWQRVLIMEIAEFFLQMVKLASYSGKDLFTGETLPATDDKVVVFHTCVLCFDLLCMGLCIYFRMVFAAISIETVVDILYTLTPIAALGALVEPATWYMLRDDNMSMIFFFTTLFPMLRSLSSLSHLDQINLNLHVRRVVKRNSLVDVHVDTFDDLHADSGESSCDNLPIDLCEEKAVEETDEMKAPSSWRNRQVPWMSLGSLRARLDSYVEQEGIEKAEVCKQESFGRSTHAVHSSVRSSEKISKDKKMSWAFSGWTHSEGTSTKSTKRSFSRVLRRTFTLSDEAAWMKCGYERQKGVKPLLILLLRFAASAGLLAWVLMSMSHPCEELGDVDGWRCDWITHPIFKNPSCDCKIISGIAYQKHDNGSYYCALDGFFPLVRVGSSIEYLFIQGHPSMFDCSLDEERLSRFDDGWLKHLKGLQMNTILLATTELPEALSQAKNLRSLQVQVSQIGELPNWFAYFRQLRHLTFIFGRLNAFPSALEQLTRLDELDLSGNPLCADSSIDFTTLRTRYKEFDCFAPYLLSNDGNVTINSTQNDTVACSRYGGIWAVFDVGNAAELCSAQDLTTCTAFCEILAPILAAYDTREPKGALDFEECSSDQFQGAFSALLGADSWLTSDMQLRCTLETFNCQGDGKSFGWNTTQVWMSTVFKMSQRHAGEQISDCSECARTPGYPYYSLELQDPNDATKRKR